MVDRFIIIISTAERETTLRWWFLLLPVFLDVVVLWGTPPFHSTREDQIIQRDLCSVYIELPSRRMHIVYVVVVLGQDLVCLLSFSTFYPEGQQLEKQTIFFSLAWCRSEDIGEEGRKSAYTAPSIRKKEEPPRRIRVCNEVK